MCEILVRVIRMWRHLDIADSMSLFRHKTHVSASIGIVNVIDKVRVRNCFGQPGTGACADADVDCSGRVNVIDKVRVRNGFGQSGCGCPTD